MGVVKEIDSNQYPYLSQFTAPVKKPERAIVGRELEMKRLAAAMMRPELCNVILLGDAGSGKALADNTPIPVADSREFVYICDLKIGDVIFDDQGKQTVVTGVFPQGNKAAYRVTFASGATVVCNTEHLWTVHRHYGCQYESEHGRYQITQTLGEIMNSQEYKDCDISIPVALPVEYPEANISIDLYRAGVMLSCVHFSNRQVFAQPPVESSLSSYLIDMFGCDTVKLSREDGLLYFTKSVGTESRRTLRTREIQQLYKSHTELKFMFNSSFNARYIPRLYMRSSVEQRQRLLRGLMDGSGFVVRGSYYNLVFEFQTTSQILLRDVRELLCSLGLSIVGSGAGSSYRKKRRNGALWLQFSTGNTGFIPFECPEKLKKLKRAQMQINEQVKAYVAKNGVSPICETGCQPCRDDKIVSIKRLHRTVPMTCIMVDSPSHLFLATRNYIVTHNTMLVQGSMMNDDSRFYLEIDLAKMIADLDDANKLAARLKELFDEVTIFRKKENVEIVLFIDEFHQIVQLSAAAVEVLKPLLADSGTRGIRVIAATTYIEFREYIQPNLPLVQRLQRINVTQPNRATTVAILRGMSERYGVLDQFPDDSVFELIYEYTNRYVPANSQPRKSLIVFDSMVGWHRYSGRPIDVSLLADVIYESEGVNVAFRVDALSIKKKLDSKVFAQELATTVIARRLQLCVADLHNKDKPMSSFLFAGSTGVGKTEVTKQLAEILFEDSRSFIAFDMSEYSLPESMERFRVELCNKAWERPYSIILLDEIEKACGEVTRMLLQVLADGRLSDSNNREVSFTNAYIILTTNAGSEVFTNIGLYNESNSGDGSDMGNYMKLIRRSITETSNGKFPPELLGRVDAVVPFQPLSLTTKAKIVKAKMRKMAEEVKTKHGIKLVIDGDRIIRYLTEDKADNKADSGGAREIVSLFESDVVTELAAYINAHKHENIKLLGITISGRLAADNKNQLVSEGKVLILSEAEMKEAEKQRTKGAH